MPTFPKLDKSLTLIYCSEQPLQTTLDMASATSSRCSVDFTPLSKLKFLVIDGFIMCRIKHPMNWMKNLTSLEHLQFHTFSSNGSQEMENCFKDDLCCFPSLNKLIINFSPHLEAFPDWICNISSLQHIELKGYQGLASLPEAMPRLTNLHTLKIFDCPSIIEECKDEASAARHKIAHIPNIIISEKRYLVEQLLIFFRV